MGNMWNNLGVWLAMVVGVGVMAAPLQVHGEALDVANFPWAANKDPTTMRLKHLAGSSDGYDTFDDSTRVDMGPYDEGLEIFTSPYATNLYSDARPLSSEKDFSSFLKTFGSGGGSQSFPTKFYFEFNLADPQRHYWADITASNEYTQGVSAFSSLVNIRDVISAGGYLDGPTIENVPNGQIYGTLDVHCPFNKLTSSSTSGGTNSPTGSETVDYESGRVVTNRANSGWFVDNVVVTRTGDTGERTVETNDVDGTSGMTNYYETVMDGLKGSNSVNTTYSEASVPNHPFVFRDSSAGVDVTNQVQNNAYWSTNFPRYLYPEDGKRLEAKTIDVLGVPVGLN